MFWDNFIALCTEAGKSPSNVAAEIGLSNATASGWKKGAQPRPTVIKRLADYFGVPVSALTGENAIPAAPAKKDGPAPMTEGEAYWAELLSRLSPSDQALLGSVAERFREDPEATRAAVGLLLAAVRSVPQGS